MNLFAYLDPGSASALLAAVLAGVAGIGAAFRSYSKNFLNFLMFWKKKEPEEAAVEATPGTGADSAPANEEKPSAE